MGYKLIAEIPKNNIEDDIKSLAGSEKVSVPNTTSFNPSLFKSAIATISGKEPR